MPKHNKIVLDTVTISNFLNADILDLLCEFYRDSLYVTEVVIVDLEKGDFDISTWINDGRIKRVVFDYDISFLKKIRSSLHDGEISCIMYARETNITVATDDKSARKTVSELCGDEKLTGTVGLLYELLEADLLTSEQARALLQKMINYGYFPPANIPF